MLDGGKDGVDIWPERATEKGKIYSVYCTKNIFALKMRLAKDKFSLILFARTDVQILNTKICKGFRKQRFQKNSTKSAKRPKNGRIQRRNKRQAKSVSSVLIKLDYNENYA